MACNLIVMASTNSDGLQLNGGGLQLIAMAFNSIVMAST